MAVVLPQGALAQDTSVLKICKEAGEGVEVGTLFTFNVDGQTVTVPAGHAPGGYCAVAGEFRPGSDVNILESLPDGYTVTGISVEPPGAIVGAPDLEGKQVTVNLGSGITEVTFTNEWHIGWLEICKEGDTSGDFSFTLSPSLASAGPFTVPAGACTPAIEVPSGTITITEVAVSGVTMLSCRTIPADRQGECNPKARTSKVKIIPGDISQQTVAFIENRGNVEPQGSGYDVAIEKISNDDSWPAGGTAYFVLRPTNIGTTITPPGTTIVVTDPIPAGFTISSVSGGPYWNCLFSTGTPANLSCTYSGPLVGPGQPFPPIQLVVNVPKEPREYRNCAKVALTGATDIDLSNNNSCTVVTVDVGKIPAVAHGGVVIVGVFTGLDGTTVVNTGPVGEVGPVTVTGVDGEPVDSDDVDIQAENGTIEIAVDPNIQVGTITVQGSEGTIVLEADGARPSGPPGITWPKDGAVNIHNGTLNETFAVPSTITEGARPAGDYEVRIGDSPVDVIAIRNGEIAVTGRGIPMQESGETEISIAVKDGPSVSGQIPAWSYLLSAQAVTRLNTWAPIFFQCSGLPAREPIAIRFTPEPWQRIEPPEFSLTCGEASSRIQIGQYQTSREGPQNLPAVIDRTPGR